MKKRYLALISGTTFIIGYLTGQGVQKSKFEKDILTCGNLRIDQSEADEQPKIFLELEVPLIELEKKKVATLRVIKENYISHK